MLWFNVNHCQTIPWNVVRRSNHTMVHVRLSSHGQTIPWFGVGMSNHTMVSCQPWSNHTMIGCGVVKPYHGFMSGCPAMVKPYHDLVSEGQTIQRFNVSIGQTIPWFGVRWSNHTMVSCQAVQPWSNHTMIWCLEVKPYHGFMSGCPDIVKPYHDLVLGGQTIPWFHVIHGQTIPWFGVWWSNHTMVSCQVVYPWSNHTMI